MILLSIEGGGPLVLIPCDELFTVEHILLFLLLLWSEIKKGSEILQFCRWGCCLRMYLWITYLIIWRRTTFLENSVCFVTSFFKICLPTFYLCFFNWRCASFNMLIFFSMCCRVFLCVFILFYFLMLCVSPDINVMYLFFLHWNWEIVYKWNVYFLPNLHSFVCTTVGFPIYSVCFSCAYWSELLCFEK